MSNSKIPIIAITPEAEEDDDHNYQGMTDTLTDVESLDSDHDSNTKNRPPLSKLKIKITNSGGVTDVEDLDLSDNEDHNKSLIVTLDDLSANLDAIHTEETCKSKSKNAKGKKRLHSQFSIKSSDGLSVLSPIEAEQAVTDVEDLNVSDNEETPRPADYEITEDMLENTVLTQISLKLHEDKRGGLSPVPPKINVTDTECLDSDSNDEQRPVVNKKVKRRKPRAHRHVHVVRETTAKTRDNDAYAVSFVKRNETCIKPPREDGHTDVEVLNSSADEMPVTVLARLKTSDTDYESVTDDEPCNEPVYKNVPIPEPYRKRTEISEAAGRPLVKVTPLESSYALGVLHENDDGITDEESLSDTEALLFAETMSRGPTPDISIFDDSYEQFTETYRERSRTPINESLTDTEYLPEKPRRTQVRLTARDDETDLESVAMSDVEEIDRARSMSVTPSALREFSTANILSKEGVGPFTNATRLQVNRRVSYSASAAVTPVVTDTEDVYASAVDDEAAASDFDVPDGSSHVHLHSTSRIDYDAPNEIMYLKGGDGFREVYTDVEDMNLTDTDDDHECKYKKKVSVDILGDDKVLVSMQNSCRNKKVCHTLTTPKGGIDWDASGKAFAEKQISTKGAKTLDAVQKGWQDSPEATSPRASAPFRATHEEGSFEAHEHTSSSQSGQQQRQIPDQHQLSDEMKRLLKDMENESKK